MNVVHPIGNQQQSPPVSIDGTAVKPKENRGGPRPGSGRPRVNPLPEPKQARAPKPGPLLLPPLPQGRNTKPVDMMRWWAALTEEHLKHLTIYTYRNWPVMDVKQFDPKAPTNIHVFSDTCPFDPAHWERDMMAMFGSGDYNFKINEGSINRWTIYVRGLRDLDNYPPLIDDSLLVLDDPANKTYIAWARNHGRILGPTTTEGQNDMATTAAVDRLASANERLADRVIDMAERATDRREPVNPVDDAAQMRTLEMMERASDRALNVMEKSYATNVNASDPMTLVSKVVELTKAMGSTGEDRLTPLFMQQIASADKRADQSAAEVWELRHMMNEMLLHKRDEPERDPFAGIKQFKELKELFADITGKGKAEGEEGEEPKPKGGTTMTSMLVEGLMRNLPAVLQGATALSTNLFNGLLLMRSQNVNGQIPAQPPTPGTPPTAQQPPQMMPSVGQLPQPGPPPTDPMTEFAAALTPAFLHHLNDANLNGATFAGWLIDSRGDGRLQYDKMKEAGPEQITQLLSLYPPLWSQVSAIPTKLTAFIEEFIQYDEEQKAEEMEGELVTA